MHTTGDPPINLAVGNTELFEFLVDLLPPIPASVLTEFTSPLVACAALNLRKVYKHGRGQGDQSAPDELAPLARLLAKGYSVNNRSTVYQATPLFASAAANRTLLTEFLLKNGADPTIPDIIGQVPIFRLTVRSALLGNFFYPLVVYSCVRMLEVCTVSRKWRVWSGLGLSASITVCPTGLCCSTG